jgi:hypothetical protein
VGHVSALWALETATGDVFTRRGAILVHDNREELEFLFPGRRAKEVTGTRLPTARWRDHPDMASVRWPLRREDFQ